METLDPKQFSLIQREKLENDHFLWGRTEFEPLSVNFGHSYNKTVKYASLQNKVCFLRFDSSIMSFKTFSQGIGVLSDLGIICFKLGNKNVLDFIPLAGCELDKDENKQNIIISGSNKKRTIIFNSKQERDCWFSLLAK